MAKRQSEFDERFRAKQRGEQLEKKRRGKSMAHKFNLTMKHEPSYGSDGSKESTRGSAQFVAVAAAPESKKPSRPQISWDDIAGCDDAKEALREAIEYPQQHAELYAQYGQTPSKGVLLYGPPGNGKTLLARAAANALGIVIEDEEAPQQGAHVMFFGEPPQPPQSGFIVLNGAELANCYFGETEKKIREVFQKARQYKSQSGRPAVIFIDEADAMLADRNSGSFASRIAVPSFLAELDGIRGSGAFLLIATNRPDTLDPAICRDGRIDRKIFVGRPDRKGCKRLLELALKGKPVGDGDLANEALSCIWSDQLALFEILFADETRERVLFRDAVSGAMMVGIVRRATEFALARDRANVARGEKVSGISCADIRAAVWQAHIELQRVSQSDLVFEKIEAVEKVPVAARKAVYERNGLPWHRPHFAGEEKVVVRSSVGQVLN